MTTAPDDPRIPEIEALRRADPSLGLKEAKDIADAQRAEVADLTAAELEALAAAVASMTPAPWSAELDCFDAADDGIVATVAGGAMLAILSTDLTYPIEPWDAAAQAKSDEQWVKAKSGQEIKDARGIVALRNAYPALIAMAARMATLAPVLDAWKQAQDAYDRAYRTLPNTPVHLEVEAQRMDAELLAALRGAP